MTVVLAIVVLSSLIGLHRVRQRVRQQHTCYVSPAWLAEQRRR
jgi:hypothetical protein